MKKGRLGRYASHVKPRIEEIRGWCMEGLIEIEIAKRLGISPRTFANYKIQYQELADAVRFSKVQADFVVLKSLFKRACGMEWEETKTIIEPALLPQKDEKGNLIVGKPSITRIEKTKKYIPPDTAAAFIWLKNRAGWRDHQEIKHSGSIRHNFDLSELPDEELMKIIKQIDIPKFNEN